MTVICTRCTTGSQLVSLPADKALLSVPLFYYDSPRNTQLEHKLTLHSLLRDTRDNYLHPRAANKYSSLVRGNLKDCKTQNEKIKINLTRTVAVTRHADVQGTMAQICSDPSSQKLFQGVKSESASVASNASSIQRYVVARGSE